MRIPYNIIARDNIPQEYKKNGKPYSFWGGYTTRKEADSTAMYIRKQGANAIVRPRSNYFVVFAAPKQQRKNLKS